MPQVDFLRRALRVQRQVQRAAVRLPNNRNAYRTVPLASVVLEELADHLRRCPTTGDRFVFADEDGVALRHDTFTRRFWRPAVSAPGPPSTGMHQLRRANAAMTLNV